MVMNTNDVDTLARELTDRLVQRGRVPANLRTTAETFMRTELLRSLRKVARTTSANAGMLLAFSRSGLG